MRKTKRHLRIIAIFLLLNTINYILFPVYSLALTAGPTSPEASSFEPVDTTDMVNLLTGDFTYNIPLLEVPGPAGGYPVTLAYHAGIQPNQDASWVGLGWSLNPGAINRIVNGYADDHENVKNVDRAFWEGGERTVKTYGISYGIANGATVAMGLSFGNDTYKGNATGMYLGVGAGFTNGSLDIGAYGETGSYPFIGSYKSIGLNLGVGSSQINSLNYGASVGISLNSSSGLNVGARGGVSWTSNTRNDGATGGSLLDASISTGGSKPSLSVGGGAIGVHNNRAGIISTTSKSWKLDIPVYAGINIRLGHDYQRYWIDETANVYTNGALFYPKNNEIASNYFDDHAYDTYDLLDIDLDIVDHPNGDMVLGGSFPDYDHYTVVAQGIGGNIQPFHFQQNLYRQNKKDGNIPLVKHFSLINHDKPVEFRFINDFSNRFEYQPGNFGTEDGKPLSFRFGEEMETGENGNEGYTNNHLAGSKHVRYFTNEQIISGEAGLDGFIDNQASGFIRDNNTQIGGFIVTNQSGVNYHFTLPAYSKEEYTKSENTVDYKIEEGDTYNELSKKEKYAYTWFLTAVTGPDYIDVNNNWTVDDSDLGYWVAFEYGKWTDSYIWRNPSEGYNMDIDGKFQSFSSGIKEIYYLDAIRTASHTAFFIKKIRKDGKGLTDTRYGDFTPEKCRSDFFPTSVLGLDKILLLKNEMLPSYDLTLLRSESSEFNFSFMHTCQTRCYPCGRETCCETPEYSTSVIHFTKNVIDIGDINAVDDLETLSLRAINLESDYSLCQETPNSLSNEKLYASAPIIELDGKLTLKELHFLGKGSTSFMPPTKFIYSKNPSYNKDAFDIWGFYKSDYKEMFNENLARSVSRNSAENVDAWSLSKIVTTMGANINIEYESDTYNNPELYKSYMLNISELIPLDDPGEIEVRFHNLPDNLKNIFTSSSRFSIKALVAFPYLDAIAPWGGNLNIECNNYFKTFESEVMRREEGVADILNIYDHYLKIRDVDLHEILLEIKPDEIIDQFDDIYCGPIQHLKASYQSPIFIGGNLYTRDSFKSYGGGLRVKSIGIEHSGAIRSTNYTYEAEDQRSYGTTSFEPYGLNKEILNFPDTEYFEEKKEKEAQKLYRKDLYEGFFGVLGISREVPGPGVMYEYVTVREKVGQIELPNYTTYHFETFKKGMVDTYEGSEGVESESVNGSYDDVSFKYKITRQLALKNYCSRVGNLKEIIVFNNNGTPVYGTLYRYSNDGFESFEQNKNDYENWLKDNLNNQGVIEETFSNARFARYEADKPLPYNDHIPADHEYHLLGVISKKETFPSVPTGQVTINYLTGLTSKSENLAFDYYSGNVTKTLSADSYGNQYVSESTPAYKKYPTMGLKVDDPANKHMLTQEAATYVYKVDNETDLNPTGLLTASIQTWSNNTPVLQQEVQSEVWRKEAAYTWDTEQELNTDGTYNYDDFALHPFNWANPSGGTNWQRLNQITLYNHYSHALEIVDMNGNYAATKMDYKQEKVIASAANASYHEIAFSGAEFTSGIADPEGGVTTGSGSASTAFAHTGKYSLQVNPNTKGFTYALNSGKVDLNKKYRASVWVYLPGIAESPAEIGKVQLFYTVNGQEVKKVFPTYKKNQSKTWYLLNLDIEPSTTGNIEVSCRNNTSRGIYFDDFRVHPMDATLNTYVYDDASDELAYMLDPNNFYTRFEYDDGGRLTKVSRERLNFDFGDEKESFKTDQILKEVRYNPGKLNIKNE